MLSKSLLAQIQVSIWINPLFTIVSSFDNLLCEKRNRYEPSANKRKSKSFVQLPKNVN